MLIEFNVENYLSIKHKQTLSLIASKSNELSVLLLAIRDKVCLCLIER
jgi:AAA15 family ATPase/GTPase